MHARLLLAAALALALAAPAAADWLVTHSGEEIETTGGWEVRGALVVFESADGRLRSLRVTEIDLEASRARTDAPPEAEPEPEEPVDRGPVRVITDADVRRATEAEPPAVDPVDEETEAEAAPAPEEPAAGSLEVIDWQERLDVQANVLEITGTVVNRGASLLTDSRVVVQLLGTSGGVLEGLTASLAKPALAPGERSSFIATFPGSPGFASVQFDIQARGFRIAPKPPPPPDAADQ